LGPAVRQPTGFDVTGPLSAYYQIQST